MRFALGTGAVLALCLTLLSSASATAPGRNGPITFRRYFDDQHSWGAVFTVQTDGTHARQVTHPPRGVVDDQPDWAPDGSLIAFTRCRSKAGLCHVWTVAPDGSGISPVGAVCAAGANEQTCPDDAHPDFSPDAKQFAFVQSTGQVKQVRVTGDQIEHSAITVMNLDGGGRHVVYTTNNFSADLDNPVFSPDGKQIVFERHNSGLSKPVDKRAVFLIGADGSNLHRITPWAQNDGGNPDWSPNGNWILYRSYVEDPTGQSQYFVVHPDGTGRTEITHFAKGTHLARASFAPDGASIVLAKGPDGGNIDVYTMRSDGTELHRVTRSRLWDSAPDWGPAASSRYRATTSASLLPRGSWRVIVSKHDLISRGVIGSDISGNYGVWNWTFTASGWTERQQERLGGPVVDRHHGIAVVRNGRECLTDTGEHLLLGCFRWQELAGRLRFSDPVFTGPIALGDGPGIMKAIFTAHDWQRIARLPASATVPATSGGGLIAFTRYRLQNAPLWSEIFVVKPDGSGLTKVSHSAKAVEDDQAELSPNGRLVVFDRCTQSGPCSVWTVRSDGRGQRRISPPCPSNKLPPACVDDSNPSFAPDGKHLLFQHESGRIGHDSLGDEVERSEIVRTDLTGDHAVVIRRLDGYRGGLEAPRVSPDGKWLLYSQVNSARVKPVGGRAIFVVRLAGGSARRLTPWKLRATGGAWSPDGARILFRPSLSGGELLPGTNLYTVRPDGSQLRQVTHVAADHYVLGGFFSPDGTSIVFATDEGATPNPRGGTFADVFTMQLGTGKLTQVTRAPNLDGWPSWGAA